MDKKAEDIKAYYIAAGFIFLFAGPLIIYKPAYDYIIIKNLAGFLFAVILSAAFILQRKAFNFNRRTFAFFLLFAAWILISALKAPFGHGAAKQLEDYLLYFLVFVCALNVKIDKKWIYFWLCAGFIASVIAIAQFFGSLRYPISTFGNPNFFAGHVMMAVVIAFASLFSGKITARERVFLGAFLLVSLAAIAVVRSRAAIFAVLFGISTVLFLVNAGEKFMKKWAGYLLLVVVAAVMFPQIYSWFATNIRVYLWRGTFEMIKERPFAGWGLGNFVFFYPYFRIKEYFLQSESTPITTHAHSEFLHLWSETGVLGLLLFILFAFMLIFSLKRLTRKGGMEDLFYFGVIGGILAVLLDNLFSTNLRNPSTAMYFWFLLGISAGRLKQEEINFYVSRILWYTILAVSLVMCVFTSFYRILPEVYLKRGIWARERNNAREAVDNYLVVSSINPHNYVSRYKLAYVYGESGRNKEAKRVYLEIQESIFPHFAKIDANLGTVYLREGMQREALHSYRWAEWFNPYDVDVLCSMASIYLVFYDDVARGMEYLRKVLTIDPENGYANKVIGMLKEEGRI